MSAAKTLKLFVSTAVHLFDRRVARTNFKVSSDYDDNDMTAGLCCSLRVCCHQSLLSLRDELYDDDDDEKDRLCALAFMRARARVVRLSMAHEHTTTCRSCIN